MIRLGLLTAILGDLSFKEQYLATCHLRKLLILLRKIILKVWKSPAGRLPEEPKEDTLEDAKKAVLLTEKYLRNYI